MSCAASPCPKSIVVAVAAEELDRQADSEADSLYLMPWVGR